MLICALLLHGWIPECMNWISLWCSNTWNVATINDFLCNALGRQISSLWASIIVQFGYRSLARKSNKHARKLGVLCSTSGGAYRRVSTKFHIYISWPWLWYKMPFKYILGVCSARKTSSDMFCRSYKCINYVRTFYMAYLLYLPSPPFLPQITHGKIKDVMMQDCSQALTTCSLNVVCKIYLVDVCLTYC